MSKQYMSYENAIRVTFGLLAIACTTLLSCDRDSDTNLVSAHPKEERPDSLFIYIGGEQTYFEIDTTSILIQWNSLPATDGSSNSPNDYPNLGAPYSTNIVQGFAWYPLIGDYSYDSILIAFRRINAMNHVNEVLFIDYVNILDSMQVFTMVGDEIICRFKETATAHYISNIFKHYKLEIIDISPWHQNGFRLRVLPNCPYTTVEMSNWLSGHPKILWSEPNYSGGGGLDTDSSLRSTLPVR